MVDLCRGSDKCRPPEAIACYIYTVQVIDIARFGVIKRSNQSTGVWWVQPLSRYGLFYFVK